MNLKALGYATIAAVAFTAPAFAHHSFAMFDSEKTVDIQGTVTEFEWTNPHCWIRLDVADSGGKVVQWAVEMGPPIVNTGRGWRADTLKPGDKIALQIHPMRDGSRGGQLMAATLPDGKRLVNPLQVRQ